jgi:predicted permease
MIESAKTRSFGYVTMVVLLMVSLSARKLNTRRLRSIPVTLVLPMLLFPSVIVIMAMSFPYTIAVSDSERNVIEIDA